MKCQITTREKNTNRQNNIADLLEKLRRIFSKHDISVHFKPSNTLKQKLFHPKDKASKQKLNKLVYGAVQWGELWPLNRRHQTSTPQNMAQHRWAGQDSAVHLQQRTKVTLLMMPKFTFWAEKEVCERLSLSRNVGLRHRLSATYNTVREPQTFQPPFTACVM